MKSIRTHILIGMLAYLLPGIAISQNQRVIAFYRPGIETHGISLSVFTDRKAAIEGIYTINKDHTRHILTLGYVEHYPIWNVKGLTWYGGAGLHFGYSKQLDYRLYRKLESDAVPVSQKGFVAGSAAILGVNYHLPGLPLMIGVDLKPCVDFINGYDSILDGAINMGLCF